jgi:hypothetical protein
VFAAHAGSPTGEAASRADIVAGVQTVFLVAAPLAALALLVVLALPESPLQTRAGAPGRAPDRPSPDAARPVVAGREVLTARSYSPIENIVSRSWREKASNATIVWVRATPGIDEIVLVTTLARSSCCLTWTMQTKSHSPVTE